MSDLGFAYWAVQAADMSGRLTSIIVRLRASEGPLQAVIWNSARKIWQFNPRTAAFFLFDDRNRERYTPVDRPTAEQIARDKLGTKLPSDEELRTICAEGMSGWDLENEPYGPRD